MREIKFEYIIKMKCETFKRVFDLDEIEDGLVEEWRTDLSIRQFGGGWSNYPHYSFDENKLEAGANKNQVIQAHRNHDSYKDLRLHRNRNSKDKASQITIV